MTFVEGSRETNWRRNTKIQNDHSIDLDWEIQIDYQDSWWKIADGEPRSGKLTPTEYRRINIEIDRGIRTRGEYWGTFLVKSEGTNYWYDKQVYLIMEVGDSLEISGPKLLNINSNTGAAMNRLVLSFDKFIDSSTANDPQNYAIIPSLEILDVKVEQTKIILTTAEHAEKTEYQVHIDSLKDVKGRQAKDINGAYQFFTGCSGEELNVHGSFYRYDWDFMQPGKPMYTDQYFTLEEIPEEFQHCTMLRTGSADYENEDLRLTFEIKCESTKLFLAFDPRKSTAWNCEWVENNFVKIAQTLPVTGIAGVDYFDLYENREVFEPGDTVTLLQNGAPGENLLMYWIFLKGIKPTTDISGKIIYFSRRQPVPGGKLYLSGGLTDAVETNDFGDYRFVDLKENLDYQVRPEKIGGIWENTIRMYDAALTARIASNLIPEPVPEQRVAADVDQDGTVTRQDAELIAKYVVGFRDELQSAVGRWIFQPESRTYPKLEADHVDQDFAGIILGDVDGNWQSEPQITSPIIKSSERCLIGKNTAGYLTVPIVLRADTAISSFGLTIKYPTAKLKFVRLVQTENCFQLFVNHEKNGELKLGGYQTGKMNVRFVTFDVLFDVASPDQNQIEVYLESSFVNGHYQVQAQNSYVYGNRAALKPTRCVLHPNYPNPFNPETVIRYTLANPIPQSTVIQIFNLQGHSIKVLAKHEQAAGDYQVVWDGTDESGLPVPSGFYVVRMKSGSTVCTCRMLLLK